MPFDAFICYKRNTAEDFAEHLKKGLEENGVHAFLDTKDLPENAKGMEEWIEARNRAVIESKTFFFVITVGFDKSPEIIKELTLARRSGNKEFVYLRHKDLSPNLAITLENETLDLSRQQQVSFDTRADLLRKVLDILARGSTHRLALGPESKLENRRKLLDSIGSFAAFYDVHNLYASKRPEKLYPQLFTPEEMKSPGKAGKICRILQNYMDNRPQFKEALQNIINVHSEYSKKNIGRLRNIILDMGFTISDDFSLSDAEKIVRR